MDRINKIIREAGLNPNDFYIGKGAKDNKSRVHFRLYNYRFAEIPRREYAIQFCDNIISIWEIGKRMDLGASVDLTWGGLFWKDVNDILIKKIRIIDCDICTSAAIMPFDRFEYYLRTLNNKIQDDEYYTKTLEGQKLEIYSTKYERNSKLRQKAIEIHGTECQACGFSFEKVYGELGAEYIEVHHIKPISEGPREVNPQTDLVCLCSNCHRMIHRKRNDVLSIEKLKDIIRENKQL